MIAVTLFLWPKHMGDSAFLHWEIQIELLYITTCFVLSTRNTDHNRMKKCYNFLFSRKLPDWLPQQYQYLLSSNQSSHICAFWFATSAQSHICALVCFTLDL
ncbi:hypothetical protein ACJX0J_030494, partial [Zea mays]